MTPAPLIVRCRACGDLDRLPRLGEDEDAPRTGHAFAVCRTCDALGCLEVASFAFPLVACDVCDGERFVEAEDGFAEECLACHALGVRCCQDCGEPTDREALAVCWLSDGTLLPPEAVCDDCWAASGYQQRRAS